MNSTSYRFSFTATSLRTNDLILVAKWNELDKIQELYELIGNGKISTGKRIVPELQRRIDTLTTEELSILKYSNYKAQNEIAYLATCKYYSFIREFVVEIIREKYLLYDYEVSEGDYLTFFRSKATHKPKMDELTPNTKYKLKQVTFKILEEAKIINNTSSKSIQIQILETHVQRAIINDDPELLKVFLLSDNYIDQLTKLCLN